MTALSEYQRLEATGLWRAEPGAQRREVIVSVGDATLAIYDMRETALAHWSLAAVTRLNPRKRPALYAPAPDAEEELELDDDEMIAAIGRVQAAVARRRPRRGRLRGGFVAVLLAALLAAAVFWLPDALIRHAARVAPPAVRAEIGAELLDAIERVAGRPCTGGKPAETALRTLSERLLPGEDVRLVVLGDGLRFTERLPGGLILIGRELVEDYDGPDVLAGHVLAEAARAERKDPLERLLKMAGPMAAFRLLTTGDIPRETLEAEAEALLLDPPEPLPDRALLARFASADVPSSPYAFARDITGETVLPLIEADPVPPGAAKPLMKDDTWVVLQGICGP